MKEPIIILFTSRSGSSMVANIFKNHGLWTGDLMDWLDYKNGDIENKWFKAYWRETYGPGNENWKPQSGRNLRALFEAAWKDDIGEQRWMVKLQIVYWEEIIAHFKPWLIFVKRKPENIVKHLTARGRAEIVEFNGQHVPRIQVINERFARMDEIQKQYGGVIIDADDLIDGDYTSLQQAFAYCELEYNQAIVDQSINREEWHFYR